jgi:GLPGLI family protein
MKFSRFFLALVLSTAALLVNAQSKFEGTISSEIKATKVPAEMTGMEAMFSTSMTIATKGQMSKVEITNSMQSSIIISNEETRNVIMLIDLMGSKYAIEDQLEEGETQNNLEFSFEGGKVEMTNETKTIAGYKCKKALFTSGDPEDTFSTEVWFTEDIASNDAKSSIPGMPMEYNMSVEGIEMHYLVTSVAKGGVSNSIFEIPAGYSKMTMAEFQNMMAPGQIDQH